MQGRVRRHEKCRFTPVDPAFRVLAVPVYPLPVLLQPLFRRFLSWDFGPRNVVSGMRFIGSLEPLVAYW